MTDVDILCDVSGMDELHERLRQARMNAGFKSASGAAKHFSWGESTYRAHENGQNKFDYTDAQKYGKAFNVNPSWLFVGSTDLGSSTGINDAAREDELIQVKVAQSHRQAPIGIPPFIQPPLRADMPADLPVYGFAVGGKEDDGEFYMNGQIADYVRRPPGVPNMRGVFGVYVCGESMFPRFQPGELIFATSAQPPAIGDDVVIELKAMNPESDDEADHAARGLIKRLKRRSGSRVIVEQFNPAMDIEFDREEIKAIHRVLTNKDLFGV
jgi:phage repressor protein C with HTH and peptisase S24 domain